MGYQPGHGIGKGNTGRTTPVPIEIKAGKQGLGIAENRKRKKLHDDQQRIQRGQFLKSITHAVYHVSLYSHFVLLCIQT